MASASFVSAHASVRQAIETALPQLQQALAQAGISLGQTSVGEQAAQQQFAQNQGGGTQRQGSGLTGGARWVADASRPASASPATPTRWSTPSRNRLARGPPGRAQQIEIRGFRPVFAPKPARDFGQNAFIH